MRKPVPFGKYLLLDRVAVGGMAEVFAAKTFGVEGFERLVAIKRILPTMVEDEEFISMFKDEARIASLLQHANLVHIFDLGKHDDTFFIAMEYISGRDVRLLIDKFRKQQKTMPIEMACFIMARMCEGLDYAHRKKDTEGNELGIIHRDISPQNVLVSYDGDVKVIDFGIAKAAGRLQHTQAGILKGKFGYMSPEQVRGLAIDHRSDIYSAGVMFYEMLTGTKLFTGESDFSTLEKVRAGEVPAPSEANPDIPPALERIVLKALAKEREDRYQWAGDLHLDLTRYLYSRDEIFSSKGLGQFMKDAFQAEYAKEQERIQRWWATVPESVENLETAPAPQPVSPPTASNPRVRIGPPSAFMTEELRLGDRTGLHEPFDASKTAGDSRPLPVDRSQLKTEAVSLAELGLDYAGSDSATIVRSFPPEEPAAPVVTGRNRRVPPPETSEPRPRPAPPPDPVEPPRKRSLLAPLLAFAATLVLAAGAFFAWKSFQPAPLGAFILSVEPKNGVRIFIDEVSHADPLPMSKRLPVGAHRLRVEAPGHKPHEADFTLVAQSPLQLSVTLEPLEAPPEQEPNEGEKPVVDAEQPPPSEPEQPSEKTSPSGKVPTPEKVAEAKPVEKKIEPRVVEKKEQPKSVEPKPVPVAKEPEPESKSADAAPGTLLIFTSPRDALVAVDGRMLGKSPVRAENLPGGRSVSLRVMLTGHKPLTVTQMVPAGNTETVRLTLEPMATETSAPVVTAAAPGTPAQISAMCVPVAMLVVNGKSTGRWTPISRSNPVEVPAGVHTLACEAADGTRGPSQQVELVAGQSYVFRGKL